MDFDQIINRRDTESIKWNRYGEDVLPMWVADMDFRSPEAVIQALHERVEHRVFGYGGAPEGLQEAIADHLAGRQGWHVDVGEIAFISGVVTGFTHAIYSLTDPGDGVLIQTPAYPPFLAAPKSTGRKCVINALVQRQDGKYFIDFDDFARKITAGVKLFILCNPQNPTGRVFTYEELERMAEICLENDVLICSDEIHADLVFGGYQHIPIASLSEAVAAKTVTYFAPSKTFNVAGFSTSIYVAKDAGMRKKLAESMCLLLGHPNILGLHAARAAYRHGGPWLDALLDYLEQNRDVLTRFVADELPGIEMHSPEGTYLGWLDCRGLGLSVSPHTFFLEKAKVAVNEGADFGEVGEGFVRINFGCPRAVLLQGLTKMKAALDQR